MRAAILLVCLAYGVVRAGAEPGKPAAQPTRDISFLDAIDLGLRTNLGLRSQRISALVSRLQIAEQEAVFDPVLSASASGTRDSIPSRSTLAGADVVDSDSESFVFGVTKATRLGPSLGLQWRTDRSFTNSSFSTINPAYDSSLAFSISVPLLQNRGSHAVEAGVRAAQAAAARARFALAAQASILIRQIANAYWQLVYLQDRVEVLKKSVAVAQEVEDAERKKLRPEVGRSTPLDVVKAEAETKRRQSDLIEGRREAADAADALRRLILPFTGRSGDDLVFRAADKPKVEGKLSPLSDLVQEALSGRPELLGADANLKRLGEEVTAAENLHRPQLDLSTSVTLRGTKGDFGSSAGETFGGSALSGGASLTFTYPFGRRASGAALHIARLQKEQAEVDRLDLVNQVVGEVRQAYRGSTSALEEIKAAQEEVRAARAALEGERRRLERGTSTILFVSDLEEKLTEAELRLLQARVNLEMARIDLRKASGRLLAGFGVAVTGAGEIVSGPAPAKSS